MWIKTLPRTEGTLSKDKGKVCDLQYVYDQPKMKLLGEWVGINSRDLAVFLLSGTLQLLLSGKSEIGRALYCNPYRSEIQGQEEEVSPERTFL